MALQIRDLHVQEHERLSVHVLTEADKQVIRENKVPMPADLLLSLYNSLYQDVPQPHGKNETKFHMKNSDGTIGEELPKDYHKTYAKGEKLKKQTHIHTHPEHQRTDTTHAAYHTMNDILISVREFLEGEKEVGTGSMKDEIARLKEES